MACKHKFNENLNLENLDFEPEVLIVGTFNPAWPENNQATWFYGRTARNYFWDVLPALYLQPALRNIPAHEKPLAWKEFCSKHRIALTDLISCINTADLNNVEHQQLIILFILPENLGRSTLCFILILSGAQYRNLFTTSFCKFPGRSTMKRRVYRV